MGGWGSGRAVRWDKKTTVEECREIDLNSIRRKGFLRTWITGEVTWSNARTGERTKTVSFDVVLSGKSDLLLKLSYVVKTGEPITQSIPLQSTRPHLGGMRWWFTCPLSINDTPCRRRVGKLYLPPGARYFGCRHCYSLSYESCQESHKYDRAFAALAADLGMDFESVRNALMSK